MIDAERAAVDPNRFEEARCILMSEMLKLSLELELLPNKKKKEKQRRIMDLITLRRSNFISTCGAGSIVDFRSDKASISVLVLLFDNWQSSRKIFEPRLANF